MGEQSTGPQISESMSMTGTVPDIASAAYLVGGSLMVALALGTVHGASVDGFLARQSGMFSPTSGDSLIATTEIPWLCSCFQYWAIPAPMSACAPAPPPGSAGVARPGKSLVITTSGLMVVTRSCITVLPQVWQDV